MDHRFSRPPRKPAASSSLHRQALPTALEEKIFRTTALNFAHLSFFARSPLRLLLCFLPTRRHRRFLLLYIDWIYIYICRHGSLRLEGLTRPAAKVGLHDCRQTLRKRISREKENKHESKQENKTHRITKHTAREQEWIFFIEQAPLPVHPTELLLPPTPVHTLCTRAR